jgi:hypothetical protein
MPTVSMVQTHRSRCSLAVGYLVVPPYRR